MLIQQNDKVKNLSWFSIKTQGVHFMKLFFLIPWTALLFITLLGFHYFQVDLSTGSASSIIVIIVSFLVLVLEFIKSGDIQFKRFIWDLTQSIVLLILATGFYSYLFFCKQHLFFVDYIAYFVIVFDSWLSPINAFRTALRNLQIGDK